MALIKCSECGHQISDTAERCPQCGHKTKKGTEVTKAKVQLVRLVVAACAFFSGLLLFFAHVENVPWRYIDDIGDFFQWMDYNDEFKTFLWLCVSVCLMVCGVIQILGLRQQLKDGQMGTGAGAGSNTDLGRQCWRCGCGNLNSGFNAKCTECGAEKPPRGKSDTQ